MTILPDRDGWYAFERGIPAQAFAQLGAQGPIAKLSLHKLSQVTVRLARDIAGLRVEQLWLWSEVTRSAMRYIVQVEGLRELDILSFGAGRMPSFAKAAALEVLRANHYMTEADLQAVAQCASLRELGAQGADLTPRALAAILALPKLVSLDLEGTRFDDKMARMMARSQTVEVLSIPNTRISRAGLAHLCGMHQLRELDLWSTRLTVDDLGMLATLPELEYLSLGDMADVCTLDPAAVTDLLLSLPKLKRVWMEGIALNPQQQTALDAKLDYLNIT